MPMMNTSLIALSEAQNAFKDVAEMVKEIRTAQKR